MDIVQPTLKKIQQGHQLDKYTVIVDLDGVKVPAGTLYILRSLVEKCQISINIGPGEMPVDGSWTQEDVEFVEPEEIDNTAEVIVEPTDPA